MKFRGAEAIVETIEWNGQTVISKMRNPSRADIKFNPSN